MTENKKRLIGIIKKEGLTLKFKPLSESTLEKVATLLKDARKNRKITITKRNFRAVLYADYSEYLPYELRVELYLINRTVLHTEIFKTLKFDNSRIEEIYKKAEADLSIYNLKIYIDENKDVSYRLNDRKKLIYCYLCNTSKETNQIKFDWTYKTRAYCKACANLTDKEIKEIKNVQKEKELLKLKKLKAIQEKTRKEARQRQLLDNEKLYRAEQELYRYEYFHEHGVYPKPTKSDNNIIYVWQYDNMYKIGITSKRRGTSRIYDVAKAGNMRANILHYVEVDDALLVEKELLVYGDQVCFDHNFDGCTEFRYLSNENLEDIAYIINTHANLY